MNEQDNNTRLSYVLFVTKWSYETFERVGRVTEDIFKSWCCSLDIVMYPNVKGKVKCKLMPTEKYAISLAGTQTI